MSGFESPITFISQLPAPEKTNFWGQTSQWVTDQAQKAKESPGVQDLTNASTHSFFELQDDANAFHVQPLIDSLTSTKFDTPISSLPFDLKAPDVSQIGKTFLGLPLNFMDTRTSWLQQGLDKLPNLEFKPNVVSYYTPEYSPGGRSGLFMRDDTYQKYGCNEQLAYMIYTKKFPF
jgi:hypothetical protein